MYERFTDRCRRVMQLANQEALKYNHPCIRTEHILLGLLHDNASIAGHVLLEFGVSIPEVEKAWGGPAIGMTMALGKLPQSPEAKAVVGFAIESARELGHSHVGTEHILLGILKQAELPGATESAGDLICRIGNTSFEAVRQRVLRILTPEPAKSEKVESASDEWPYRKLLDRIKLILFEDLSPREAFERVALVVRIADDLADESAETIEPAGQWSVSIALEEKPS